MYLGLLKRIKHFLKRKVIKIIGIKLNDNYFLDNPHVGSRKDIRRLGIYSKQLNIEIPQIIDNDILTYSFPRRYVYELYDVTIDLDYGIIYDSGGKYIAESSSWDYQRLLFECPQSNIKVPKKSLPGKYIFLNCVPNLYHFLIEEFPPFYGALKYADDETRLIMKKTNFPPISNYIKSHIDRDIIYENGYIKVDKLIMVGKNSGFGSPIPPHNTPHPFDVSIVRNYFLKNTTNPTKKDFVYISRTKSKRSVLGEHVLEEYLENLGFYIYHGAESFEEQVHIFKSTKLIVGMQGGGMTNIVWLPKNSKVLQLHFKNSKYKFFFNLGKILDLNYKFLEVPEKKWSLNDIQNIVQEISSFIEIKK